MITKEQRQTCASIDLRKLQYKAAKYYAERLDVWERELKRTNDKMELIAIRARIDEVKSWVTYFSLHNEKFEKMFKSIKFVRHE